jgi:type 2 lantibiotic biosynthesis protein LanM
MHTTDTIESSSVALTQKLLESATWFEALTLTERIAIKRCQATSAQLSVDVSSIAKLRFDQWRNQAPFSIDDQFVKRLAMEGIDESTLLGLLDETPDSIRDGYLQAVQSSSVIDARIQEWIQKLNSAFGQTSASPDSNKNIGSFLNVVRPLIVQGFQSLQQDLDTLERYASNIPYDRIQLEDIFLDQLAVNLERILGPTLVLELNVARVEDRLQGETANERYANFVRSLLDHEVALAILAEYPVAARLTVDQIDRWRQTNIELMARLLNDWKLVRNSFYGGMDLGKLTSIHGQAGDAHRGGRSVKILEFDSGVRLVYKPRSLAIDLHFQHLLEWFNRRSQLPNLRTLVVEDRGTYGWVEFVSHQSCQSEDEVRRFYQRHGAYLAILYILAANDMHSENIIACGEHPVPIDVETLFQPLVPSTSGDSLLRQYHRVVERSVLKSNLLPRLVWSQGGTGIDISGIGGKGGQLAPDSARTWSDFATDQMHIVRERFQLLDDRNRPTFNESIVDALEFSNEVINGFEIAYDTLCQHREELLSSNGPLQQFRTDENRVVLRDTRTYALLLRESYHPDLMRNGLLRDRHFDRLWARVGDDSHFRMVVPQEQRDIRDGDIPVFSSRIEQKTLIASDGTEIANYFLQSGWQEVCERIEQLGQSDKCRQLTLLRSSLGQLVNTTDHTHVVVDHAHYEPLPYGGARFQQLQESFEARCCNAVAQIADLLATDVITDGQRVIWTSLTPKNNGWVMAPTGIDLYSGLPGIAMFLAYAGKELGDPVMTNTAYSAMQSLLQALGSDTPPTNNVGGFSGLGGIVYTLSHLGSLWGRKDLLDRATAITQHFPDLIDNDEELDVIGGSAGCIASCLSLHACAPSDHLLALVERCASRLIDRAQPCDGGIGWHLKDISDQPLTGFSHGAAGFAWALDQAFEATGVEKFRKGANEAIEFERQHFSLQSMNWLDYRRRDDQPTGAPASAITWCHGAPGIGLARVNMKQLSNCERTRQEIDVALQTTLSAGFGKCHCLCHGDLGNLELLVQVTQRRDDQALRSQLNDIVTTTLEHALDRGWRCGVPNAIPVPGMMTGLSGMGFQLLRIAKPNLIPSILTLDPPPADIA